MGPDAAATNAREHWNAVHRQRDATELSWYTTKPASSLAMFEHVAPAVTAAVLDIGGGVSHLADVLIARGHRDVTVLDISADALAVSRGRVGDDTGVHWVEADVLTWRPPRRYDVWHDRALFHFLTDPGDRARYRDVMRRAVAPGGLVIIGTFGPDGPTTCSGLPVVRYDADALAAEFADTLTVIAHAADDHMTPGGVRQRFTWIAAANKAPDRSRPHSR